jgi:hypothetical protein
LRKRRPRASWPRSTGATWRKPEDLASPASSSASARVPDFLQDVIDFSQHVHFSDGHLNRRTKEMIATYVSGLNRCPY